MCRIIIYISYDPTFFNDFCDGLNEPTRFLIRKCLNKIYYAKLSDGTFLGKKNLHENYMKAYVCI